MLIQTGNALTKQWKDCFLKWIGYSTNYEGLKQLSKWVFDEETSLKHGIKRILLPLFLSIANTWIYELGHSRLAL